MYNVFTYYQRRQASRSVKARYRILSIFLPSFFSSCQGALLTLGTKGEVPLHKYIIRFLYSDKSKEGSSL